MKRAGQDLILADQNRLILELPQDSYSITYSGYFWGSYKLHRLSGVYGPLSREKGLELRVVPCTAVVRSDAALVERVVENFVSNAVRYTDEGKVLIGCRRRGDRLRIEIRDSGRGIPSDQRDAIFDEFYQVGNPGRDHSQGLGLGLSISKRVADILGHRIEVQSTPGKGSVFSVELPLSAAQEPPRVALAPVLVGGNGRMIGLVLLIEDNPSVLNAMHGVRVPAAPPLPSSTNVLRLHSSQ